MTTYDAIIIGAGPAGGQCARELSRKGYNVLLTERAKDLCVNNYSSGAAPQDIMDTFALPDSIVGAKWNKFTISSTTKKQRWESKETAGPILDFNKLKQFLADDACDSGACLKCSYAYVGHIQNKSSINVTFKNLISGETDTLCTRYLIDASGTERRASGSKSVKAKSMSATGIEYHVKVSPDVYQEYEGALNFFLGLHWMPQGYGWIFPMGHSQLKVGVIRYYQDQDIVPHIPSYKHYINQLLHLFGALDTFQIIDHHGKTIDYTFGQRDIYYEGTMIAIGDAISTVNPLGFEGIRHAMMSGRMAASTIDRCLQGDTKDLSEYKSNMGRYFGNRWWLSEKIMKQIYLNKDDHRLEHIVQSFGMLSGRQLVDVVFHYRFRHLIKCLSRYAIYRLSGC